MVDKVDIKVKNVLANHTTDCKNYTEPVRGNESYILGWQLSALLGMNPRLPQVCDHFEMLAANAAKTGLEVDAIKLPLCNRVHCDMSNDGQGIFKNLIGYVGDLFVSQLFASVADDSAAWLTLCNTINPSLASIFFGPTNGVASTICSRAGLVNAKALNFGSNNVSARAADIIHESATLLLAWQSLSFFQRAEDLGWACKELMGGSHNILPNVAALDLNATLFRTTMCQFVDKALPSTAHIEDKYDQYTSEIFAETLWNLSDSEKFRAFLCEGYREGRLNNIVSRRYFARRARSTVKQKLGAHCREAQVMV